jgi:apolipoprotein N-acyltransferase
LKKSAFLLSTLSGLLLFAAWPVSSFMPFIFIAWIPMLMVADQAKTASRFFGLAFWGLLIWNTGTTWWMWNSTDVGTIAAIMFNSMLMTFPWWGYFHLKKKGKNAGYISLIAFWMCFEYIHHNWQLSWPWLTVGNVFAAFPDTIQWYEYTGVQGGTLWVMLVNVLLYEFWLSYQQKAVNKKIFTAVLLLLLFPLAISFLLKPTLPTETSTDNIIIVQPNIDPYGKFNAGSGAEQIQLLLNLSKEAIDSNTKLIIWPETAMSIADWQSNITNNLYYQPIFEFSRQYPSVSLISGIETFKNYGTEKSTPTAREAGDGTYYDAFNAAVHILNGQVLSFYNKSKLVPGVESLPTFLNFLAPVFEQFGGTTGGYGRSESAATFVTSNHYIAAPIICYESVYGEYVGEYVKKNANLLTIMTNDGWWGNTPGHKQHLQYARLRAIETRKWVARSANTGISAVIDPVGAVRSSLPWNKMSTLKYAVPAISGETFYVRWGDYLYKLASLISILFMLWKIKDRFTKNK